MKRLQEKMRRSSVFASGRRGLTSPRVMANDESEGFDDLEEDLEEALAKGKGPKITPTSTPRASMSLTRAITYLPHPGRGG